MPAAQAFAPATNLNEEEPDDLPFNSKQNITNLKPKMIQTFGVFINLN
jgi:hypothetical protein